MKTLYLSSCTEFEAGWGQRPDGFVMGEDRVVMMEWILLKGNTGERDYFWRYDTPKEVQCSQETYDKIMKKVGEDGIAHFNNGDKIDLELFNKI